MSMHDHSDQDRQQGSLLASRAGLALLAFFAIGGFLITTEHGAHILLGALFYLLPFGCIFMHLFMHGGHGHGGHGGQRNQPDERKPS